MAVMLLASYGFCVSDACAQTRGRGIATPRHSSGFWVPSAGGHGIREQSNSLGSGLHGLNVLGNLTGSAGRYDGNGGHHGSNHHGYSDAEAYRDVGMANALVGLVGTLLDPYNYEPYPVVAAPPVEYAPVLPPYPVAMVPSPQVVVETPPYWYAPPAYSYAQPYCYPRSWNPPVYRNAFPGYWDAYYSQHRGSYDRRFPLQHQRSHDHEGSYRRSGTWQGGERTPAHGGRDIQSPRSGRQGGITTHVAPGPSRSHR